MNRWSFAPIHLSPSLSYLFNHLWQSTLVALAIWLLTSLLLRGNRPHVRYALWLAASIKFVVPFAFLVSLGSRLGFLRLASPPTQARVYFAMDEALRRPLPNQLTTAFVPATSAPRIHVPDVLLALWLCGLFVVALRWLILWLRIQREVRAARHLCHYDGVPVLSSSSLRQRGVEPGIVGLFRPLILVPEGITEKLTPEQFESVLAHESRHARRRDNLLAAVHMFVEALYWFYPLVWWIGRRLIEERERACDEDVIRAQQPSVYAEGILNVCKFYLESPLDCVPGITGADLKRRIADIMTGRNGRELDWARKTFLASASVVAFALPLAIGVLRTPASQAQTMSSFDGKMQTETREQFEVATVKPNVSGEPGSRLGPPQHGSITIVNVDVKRLIYNSFRISGKMVFGPSWMEAAKYDVVGKGPNPSATNPEVWEMMRSLLKDEFKLRYHIEQRELPVYALVIAKGGPRLKDPADGRCASAIAARQVCGDIIFPAYGAGMYNMPIGALVAALGRSPLDRPLIDKTGITGNWDATVRWMPDNMKPEELAAIPEDKRPEDVSLFTALEQQLGLKLEPRKEMVDVLVVDNIERPAETSTAAPGARLRETAFDVVSVKPNKIGGDPHLVSPDGSLFDARNVSLRMLVMRAYQLKNFEVEGGPKWLDSDRFDISARAAQAVNEERFKLMLQALLADSFGLKAHWATDDLPVFNLIVAGKAPKLAAPNAACSSDRNPSPSAPPPCGGFIMNGTFLHASSVTMPAFAKALSEMLGREVIDQTGYKNTFDASLEFSSEGIATLTGGGFEAATLNPAERNDSRPSIFAALEHDLGLKLQTAKAQVKVLVIDSAIRSPAQ